MLEIKSTISQLLFQVTTLSQYNLHGILSYKNTAWSFGKKFRVFLQVFPTHIFVLFHASSNTVRMGAEEKAYRHIDTNNGIQPFLKTNEFSKFLFDVFFTASPRPCYACYLDVSSLEAHNNGEWLICQALRQWKEARRLASNQFIPVNFRFENSPLGNSLCHNICCLLKRQYETPHLFPSFPRERSKNRKIVCSFCCVCFKNWFRNSPEIYLSFIFSITQVGTKTTGTRWT